MAVMKKSMFQVNRDIDARRGPIVELVIQKQRLYSVADLSLAEASELRDMLDSEIAALMKELKT